MTSDLEAALGRWLPSYLPTRRWFGGKGRSIRECRVEDFIELDPDRRILLAICGVAYTTGTPETYAVAVTADEDRIEAAADEHAIELLLRGFADSAVRVSRNGAALTFDDLSDEARSVFAAGVPPVSLVGAEQSNTSARIGKSFIFKLFRRVEAGENPELEVSRFLTSRTDFRATPPLAGSISYVPREGPPRTLSVLQGWIDNAGDGWTHVLRLLRDDTLESSRQLQHDMASLGRTTAALHAAFERGGDNPAFAPEQATPADLRTFVDGLRSQALSALAALDAQPPAWRPDLDAIKAAIRSRLSGELAHEVPDVRFSMIRIHGDYHLGQTLKTPSGFVIIDFEGEPAKSLEARRRKSCALKDVAGMLRSFDYAAAVSAADNRHDLGSPFVNAYLAEARRLGVTSLPRADHEIASWLRQFELEKAFYELEYELNNRPEWAAIPLAGILSVLSS